jgi:IS30 family transposase
MPAVEHTHLTGGGPIMPARPLTPYEREEIRAGIERHEPDGVIAQRLGRHRLTINGEIARNGGRGVHPAVAAQRRADEQRQRPKTPILVADPTLCAHVTARLEAKDSPMTISRELACGVHGVTGSISHESIYRGIYAHGTSGLPNGLHERLHRRRPCRRHRPRGGQPVENKSPLGLFSTIASRPAIALERAEVGHLEGDLITGAYNRSAIVTVFDRASRRLWLADFPDDHSGEATLAALCEIVERIPKPLRRTLTWDQGREMARHKELAELCGIDVYFYDPHSPWQRPTNENSNGLLRRYVGKGTDLSRYSTADLRAIEQRINTMPRRSLRWSIADAVYNHAVAMTG